MKKELYTIENYPTKKLDIMKTKPHIQKLKAVKKTKSIEETFDNISKSIKGKGH